MNPKKTKEDIRNAALACFAKHGYEKASINDIAVAAGISKASIFQYFGSKQALYQYLLDYCTAQMKQAYDANTLEENTDFFDRVWEASVMKVENLKQHPHIGSFIASAAVKPAPKLKGVLLSPENTKYVVVLSDTPERDLHSLIHHGVDICISSKQAPFLIADIILSQLRRYTEYNHFNNPENAEAASFQAGDIFIDPPRRMVKVRGQSVNLRPREFSLLLYFMRNINIVLTSEQICEHAWGMEGSYKRGVSGPIAILRKIIETDPTCPRYIETVSRIGYRFTAYHSEICDNYSDDEVAL